MLLIAHNSKVVVAAVWHRMADNFRGVLLFVNFMVDLAVMKIFHIRKCLWWWSIMRVPDDGRGQNIMAAQPTVLSVNKQQ